MGYKVRYDGADQKQEMMDILATQFELIPVCPEVAIGLSVPREKIELHQRVDDVYWKISGVPRRDLTEKVKAFAQQFVRDNDISGIILKDKSPSCGVRTCQQWNEHVVMESLGTGLFAATVMQCRPTLPLLQSHSKMKNSELLYFIQQVRAYDD